MISRVTRVNAVLFNNSSVVFYRLRISRKETVPSLYRLNRYDFFAVVFVLRFFVSGFFVRERRIRYRGLKAAVSTLLSRYDRVVGPL